MLSKIKEGLSKSYEVTRLWPISKCIKLIGVQATMYIRYLFLTNFEISRRFCGRFFMGLRAWNKLIIVKTIDFRSLVPLKTPIESSRNVETCQNLSKKGIYNTYLHTVWSKKLYSHHWTGLFLLSYLLYYKIFASSE